MLQTLASAYGFGHIEPVGGSENANVNTVLFQVLEHNQRFISNQPQNNQENKEKYFAYNMDRAQLYRMGQHFDYALDVLSQRSNFSFTINEQANANYWNCVCTNENAWFKGEIEESNYVNQIQTCNSMYAAKTSTPLHIDRSPVANSSFDVLIRKAYPNPSKGSFTIELSDLQENVSVEIHTVSGKMIWSKSYLGKKTVFLTDLDFPDGTYLIKVVGKEKAESTSIVILK